jgi:hypothetical protein
LARRAWSSRSSGRLMFRRAIHKEYTLHRSTAINIAQSTRSSSWRGLRGSAGDELARGIGIERAVPFEGAVEANSSDHINRCESCEAHALRAERSGVLHRVVESALLPPGRADRDEGSRWIGGSEEPLARWIGPSLAPASCSQARGLMAYREAPVVAPPRQVRCPFRFECDHAVPVEVQLFVELDDETALEGEIPRPWAQLRRRIGSAECSVEIGDVPAKLRRQVLDPRRAYRPCCRSVSGADEERLQGVCSCAGPDHACDSVSGVPSVGRTYIDAGTVVPSSSSSVRRVITIRRPSRTQGSVPLRTSS